MTHTTRTPECNCPYCGHKFDRVTSVAKYASPNPGDFTLCIKCSCLMVFDADLRVRGLTVEELGALDNEPGLQKVILRTALAIRPRSIGEELKKNGKTLVGIAEHELSAVSRLAADSWH